MYLNVAIVFLILVSFSSHACKCEGLELIEAFENSKSVMFVEVTQLSLKEVKDDRGVDVVNRKLIKAKFNVIESFKAQAILIIMSQLVLVHMVTESI